LTVFSQATILDSASVSKVRTLKIGKDTIIGFNVNQSKYLLTKVYHSEACDTLLSICEQQKSLSDSLRKDNLTEINHYQMIMANKDTMFGLKAEELKKTENALMDANKEIRKQKTQKVAIIVGAAAIIIAETVLFVQHLVSAR
jgi:hypothetical protein